jgi:DNA-binding response OmpR family regulator
VDETQAHDLLRAHIRNLRRKFDRRYLVSVYAVGYMLSEPDHNAEYASSESPDTDKLE